MKYELAVVKVEVADNGIIIKTSDMSVNEGYRNHVFNDVAKADTFLGEVFDKRRREFIKYAERRFTQQ